MVVSVAGVCTVVTFVLPCVDSVVEIVVLAMVSCPFVEDSDGVGVLQLAKSTLAAVIKQHNFNAVFFIKVPPENFVS